MACLGMLASAFDPFHHGYIWAMQQAIDNGACNKILAAIHDDPSLERPEKRRPVLSLHERGMILSSIRYVEEVCYYRTESELWYTISLKRPDCLIIGEDHKGEKITGNDLGIPVFWAERTRFWSGTEYCRRLAESIK